MANWYYYDSSNQRQGLITDAELKSLSARGIITPETPLETESGHKGKAGQVKGLFPVPEAPFANPTPQQPPYTQSNYTQPNYQQQQYQQQPQYGQPSYPQQPALPKPPKDYLIWSIITTLCCCLPLGVVGIIFSTQAKSAFQLGDFAGYESKTKVAFWCNLIGLISGILINGIVLILQLAASGG